MDNRNWTVLSFGAITTILVWIRLIQSLQTTEYFSVAPVFVGVAGLLIWKGRWAPKLRRIDLVLACAIFLTAAIACFFVSARSFQILACIVVACEGVVFMVTGVSFKEIGQHLKTRKHS
jgi:hypothetical protein